MHRYYQYDKKKEKKLIIDEQDLFSKVFLTRKKFIYKEKLVIILKAPDKQIDDLAQVGKLI